MKAHPRGAASARRWFPALCRAHSVREYRNLVHPGREVRENLSFGREEAAIALEVLRILVRDLRDTARK